MSASATSVSLVGELEIYRSLNLKEFHVLKEFLERPGKNLVSRLGPCPWTVDEEAKRILWNGTSERTQLVSWLQLLTDLLGGKEGNPHLRYVAEDVLAAFPRRHVLNGIIESYGPGPTHIWRAVVQDSRITVQEGTVSWR